jgi:dienelactone hydrolase
VEPRTDTVIAGPAGQIPLRIHRPVVPSDVVVVYAHAVSSERIASSTPATVVQVASGAALEEFRAAVLWTAERLRELGGRRLMLAGHGTGGRLAAGAAVHCDDEGIELAGVLMLSAATDLTFGSTAGLPPTIVGVGALDHLLEDNLAFVHRLRAAEVEVGLRVFPTLGHGFFDHAAVSPAADRACEQICSDLNRLVWDSAGQLPPPLSPPTAMGAPR